MRSFSNHPPLCIASCLSLLDHPPYGVAEKPQKACGNDTIVYALIVPQRRPVLLVPWITHVHLEIIGHYLQFRHKTKAHLRDGPCHGGVSHAPLLGDRPGTLALGNALASDATLQLGQLGLAPHVHSTLAGSSSAVVGALHDPLAFVLRQGAQECDEAATDGRGEVQVWLVEHLDHGASRVDAFDDVHAIHHRAGGANSATTSTSPVPSASIAFSSCGRPLTALLDAFSRKTSWHRSARRAPIWRSRLWVLVDTRA